MKKILFTLMFAILVISNVDAKEVYYSNGVVELTEKEYNYVKEFYGEDYLKNMTMKEYKRLDELDVNNSDVKIKFAKIPDASVNGSYVGSSNKTLGISRSCPSSLSYCIVTVLAKWLGNPSVRSWDVMGAFIYGTSLYSQVVTTTVNSTAGTTSPSNYRFLSNGFGNSFQLPSGSNVTIEQCYFVKPGGTVFASYQHAMSTSTLAKSKSYNIGVTGYGGVFIFTGSAVGIYDGMVGVDIDV